MAGLEDRRAADPRATGLVAAGVAALVGLVAASSLQAQRVNGFVELNATRTDSETTTFGLTTGDERLSLLQRYSFTANWTLFPNLLLTAGGLYERTESEDTGGEGDLDVTTEKLRPFVSLVYATPLYFADIGFYRLDDRLEAGGISQRDIQDTFNVTAAWRPEDFPVWTARFLRTEAYDENRESRDTTNTLIDLTGEYSPIDKVRLFYRGGIQEQEDRLEGTTFRFETQTGRVTYGDAWWNRRLQLSMEYNVDHLKREVREIGEGEVDTPVPALAGLAAITEFPLEVVLEPSPALIDGNRTASAGVNLGLPALDGDDRPRNLGFDFGAPRTLDVIDVWVDRELPEVIASSFQWQIYTSSDNRLWELRQTLARAPFGPFETRFELSFAELTARYVKVVASPLARGVPEAEEFPLILVTELEAFERTPADQVRDQPGRTTERFTGSLRTKLLAKRSLYHDLAYFELDPDDGPSTRNLSNALSFSQRLSDVFSLSARGAREDGSEAERDFVSYPYSAALRAAWLPTLRQSLVFSGLRTETEGETRRFQSIFLQSSAELYRGVTADLGIGRSRSTEPDGRRIESTQITGSATLIPHPKVTMNLLLQRRDSDTRNAGDTPVAEAARDLTASEISVGWRPFPALYAFWKYRLEEQTGQDDRTLENYNLSWSPFPDGSLQLSFNYDETFRSELDSETQIASASARWNITRSRYLQVSYFRSDFGSVFEDRKQESIQGSMRLTF